MTGDRASIDAVPLDGPGLRPRGLDLAGPGPVPPAELGHDDVLLRLALWPTDVAAEAALAATAAAPRRIRGTGERGLPVLALRGFVSHSYVKQIIDEVQAQGRRAVLLCAGDFDPSGEDISRDFVARTGCWDKVLRVALTSGQVKEFELPKAVGKVTDSRAAAFAARHGELVQVELDALPPDVLRSLFEGALAKFWDEAAFQQSLRVERLDRIALFGMDGR